MGKNLSKHDRAAILAREILIDFSKEIELSVLLQKSGELARLADDIENQKWIDKEISGIYFLTDPSDQQILLANARIWTSKDGKDVEKKDYKTEHVEVLETMIECQKIRLNSAKDPNISTSSSYNPIGNTWERYQILESIRIYQSILSRIKGRLYQFVLNTYHVLNFSEIVGEIFSKIRKITEENIKKLSPETLTEITTAHNLVNSKNHPDWSNVASCCRRSLMRIADKVFPASNKIVKLKNGREEKLNEKNYRLRIHEFLKGQKLEDAIARDTSELIFELLDSVDRLSAKGDKNIISQEVAEKILIYTYLLLYEIVNRISSKDVKIEDGK